MTPLTPGPGRDGEADLKPYPHRLPTVLPDRVLPDGWWRLGLTTRERTGCPPPPDWAVDAEQALAAARDTPEPVREVTSWQDGYGQVLEPFVAWATALVPPGPGTAAFAQRLRSDLVDLAARTLTLELNQRRVAGTLTGAGGRERFAYFVRQTRRTDETAALLTRYPVLARLLLVACRRAAGAYTELVRRLGADRPAIARRFFGGRDPGELVALDLGRGDRHRGGRSVSIVEFEDGRRLAYKPRPLGACAGFSRLVSWLNGQVPDLRLRTARVLERGAYGWQEHITATPCSGPAEVRRFYRRTGALLALLYAVHASDIHYGNLIASGDQPVPVDLETLFHPDVLGADVASDPAARLLARSVYRAGVLPTLLLGDRASLDISALGGDPGHRHPVDGIDWAAPATDRMRLVRRPRRFEGAGNRPVVGGRVVEPADHVDDIVDGFRAGYSAIAAGREAFLDAVSRLEPAETRAVLRPTQVYQTLLTESTHPDLLGDATARERFFDLLWTTAGDLPAQRLAVPHEIADLWQGDIPAFHTRPDSLDLRAADGSRLKAVLPAAGRDRAVDKVRGMGPADLRTQTWIVRAALATRRPADRRTVEDPPSPDPLADACAIGDRLRDLAAVDGSRANWLGVERSGDRLLVMPLGATLTYGYTGVALFLAQLAGASGVERYARLARLALGGIPQLLLATDGRPDLVRAVGCGGYEGFGGIAYALARIAGLTGDEEVRHWAHQAVRLAGEAAGEDSPPGVADGLAGCRLAMLAVHAELDHAPAAALAARCARLLATAGTLEDPDGAGPGFERDAGVPTPALANGLAGAGYRLLRLADPGRVPSVLHLEPGTTAARAARLTFAHPVRHTPQEEP